MAKMMQFISVAQMEKEIKKLSVIDGFWEKVRLIVGYYDPKIHLEDRQIKKLQRIADARYAEII